MVLHTYVLRVQYSCGVVFVLWFWREMVFGVTYVLSVQYSCAVVSEFSTFNTLLLYSLSPYRQTDGEMNSLTSRGLEEPAHASRGLEEPFFQLCCCVSFWFWREIGFGFTYLRT